LEVPLPPIGEQQRIAAMLDQAEGLRAKRRQALSKLDTLNHSLFLEMFGDPRSNTRGLPTATVGKLLTLKSGNFLPASKMAASGVHPVYGGNGVNGHHDEYMFEQRVISIGRVGVYCGVVHLTEPRSWVTDNSLFVAGFDPAVSQGYLCEALKMANLNQYASQSGQPLISASRLSDVRLLIPPIRDQLQFEGVVAGMNTINAQVQRSSGFIDDLFSSLQQRAFTGEL
jgi:type I restriction enzyme S subunit